MMYRLALCVSILDHVVEWWFLIDVTLRAVGFSPSLLPLVDLVTLERLFFFYVFHYLFFLAIYNFCLLNNCCRQTTNSERYELRLEANKALSFWSQHSPSQHNFLVDGPGKNWRNVGGRKIGILPVPGPHWRKIVGATGIGAYFRNLAEWRLMELRGSVPDIWFLREWRAKETTGIGLL